METSLKSQILKACRLTEEELTDMQLDTAHEYLVDITHNDEWAITQIKSTALFWKWWMQQWHQRDEEFLNCLVHKCNWNKASDYMKAKLQPEALLIYQCDHSVAFLKEKGIRPHRMLMRAILLDARKEVCNG
jgi:DNA-binding GntR family transcriptional regulator